MRRIDSLVIHVTDKDIFDLVCAKYPELAGAVLTITNAEKPPSNRGPSADPWETITIERTKVTS
jgi:hypothetical protein